MAGFYYTIPATIFYDKKVSANAKLLACLVANFCDRYGKCFVTNKHLGDVLNRSESTVSRLVSELVDAGYFDIIVDRDDNNKRTLTLSSKMLTPIRKNEYTYTQKCVDNNTIYNNTISNTVEDVVKYLNDKANTSFTTKNKSTVGLINSRIKEGYSLDDFTKVVDTMVKKWKGTEWEMYLAPQTLFRPSNFEKYLNFANKEKVEPKTNRIVI
jgi:uncharacterized phage protein (TIGR02220 family)